MKRNTFIQQLAVTTVASSLLPNFMYGQNASLKAALLNKIGIQLFSIPKLLSENLEMALETLQQMGYTSLETFGPYTFSAQKAQDGWKNLAQFLGPVSSGLQGHTPQSFKELTLRYGFQIPSMHTDLETLEHHMAPLAAAAHKLGATYVVLPMIPYEERKTLEDYKKMADRFNAIGAQAQKEGIRFAYHNHGAGFRPINGVVPFEYIIKNTNPDTVDLELDIFWTAAAGVDPVALMNQYTNRYKLMHVKDMKMLKTFENEQIQMQDLMAFFPLITSCGQGVLDLPAIIAKGVEIGISHFFVEQDLVQEPKTALAVSAAFLLT